MIFRPKNLKDPAVLNDAGYLYSELLDKYNMAEQSVDFVYLANQLPSFNFPGNLKQLYNYETWKTLTDKTNCHPVYNLSEYISATERDYALNLVIVKPGDLETDDFGLLPLNNTLVFVLETDAINGMQDQRGFFFKLQELGLDVPVIIKRTYPENEFDLSKYGDITSPEEPVSKLQLYAATDMGALLVDGLGDGIWIDAPSTTP